MNTGGSNTNLPPPASGPLGLDKYQVNTNQQAAPVPWFSGIARIGVTWISSPFATQAHAVNSNQAKGDSQVAGYNYFADIAGLACVGPVDEIFAVYLNRQLVWGVKEPYGALGAIPVKRGGDTDFKDITLTDSSGQNWGVMRIYWGTETQGFDPVLQSSPQSHPAYRGFCYVVFKQLFLGYNQTNIQNVELVLARYPGDKDTSRIANDANPIYSFIDLAQHPRAGLSIPDSFFDPSIFETALTLRDAGVYLSPMINQRTDLAQIALTLMEYFDGYISGSNGKFGINISSPPGSRDDIISIDIKSMVSRPSFSPSDWTTVSTETSIQYNNAKHGLQDDVAIWRDLAARIINGNTSDQIQVDRSWITSDVLAGAVARNLGIVNSLPSCSGSVKLRKTGTLFADMAPGALFYFDYERAGSDVFNYRVTERSISAPGDTEFDISFVIDYSYLNQNIARTDIDHITKLSLSPGELPSTPDPAIPISAYRVVELPIALCPEGKVSLAVLAARPTNCVGFNVWIGKNENNTWIDSYSNLSFQSGFAFHGFLQSDFPIGSIIDNSGTLVIQLDDSDSDISEQALFDALSNNLLIFIGSEVLSVIGASIVGANTYSLSVVRGRYSTQVGIHSEGDEAYIVKSSDITPIHHGSFQPNNTSRLKLQPVAPPSILELGDIESFDFTTLGFIYTQTPVSGLSINGKVSAAFYNSGGSVTISWNLTDAGRDYFQPDLFKATTLLTFLDGDTVLATKEFASGSKARTNSHDDSISSTVFTNAQLIALLGSEISFTVKAETKVDGDLFIATSPAVQLYVTKI